jgi:mannitol-specific phosphotransferase system IIBC component
MDSTQNRQKSSLLINPKFQWTLIGYTACVATLILIAVYGLFTFGFHEFVQIGTQAGLPPDHVYFQFIQMQETTFLRVIAAISVLVAIILIVGGMIISHKVAGPIYRMQKEFNKMREANPVELHPVQFRKGDFFPELADSFNDLVIRYLESRKP